MRILRVADLHLGQTIHERDRSSDQDAERDEPQSRIEDGTARISTLSKSERPSTVPSPCWTRHGG